jgi:hypothetical protein
VGRRDGPGTAGADQRGDGAAERIHDRPGDHGRGRGPALEIGPLLEHSARVLPYTALVPPDHLHPNVGQQPNTTTNGLLAGMTGPDARAVMTTGSRVVVQLRSLGGAINDVPPDATAYAHRHQSTMIVAATFPPGNSADLDAAWRGLEDRVDGGYVNFETRPAPAAFRRIYPGPTGARVAGLWRRFDPDGIFRPALLADRS